jgi:hypothetical protein
MKLRIKGNSIRLRLLRSEVERFAADGKISEETAFGPSSLRYSLYSSQDAEKMYAELTENEIRVFIPADEAARWSTNDQVGLEVEQFVGGDEVLSILVEKDFVCLDRPDDPDRDDAFPNPLANC